MQRAQTPARSAGISVGGLKTRQHVTEIESKLTNPEAATYAYTDTASKYQRSHCFVRRLARDLAFQFARDATVRTSLLDLFSLPAMLANNLGQNIPQQRGPQDVQALIGVCVPHFLPISRLSISSSARQLPAQESP